MYIQEIQSYTHEMRFHLSRTRDLFTRIRNLYTHLLGPKCIHKKSNHIHFRRGITCHEPETYLHELERPIYTLLEPTSIHTRSNHIHKTRGIICYLLFKTQLRKKCNYIHRDVIIYTEM